MEFKGTVAGENYQFYFINDTTVLISGPNAEYILYKTSRWHCADEIPPVLLKGLAELIEQKQTARQSL